MIHGLSKPPSTTLNVPTKRGRVNAIPRGLCYWKIRRRSAASPGLSSSCFAMAIRAS